MLRMFLVAMMALCVLPGILACEGQAGKALFEDKFADDSGASPFRPPDPEFKLEPFVRRIDDSRPSNSVYRYSYH